jgi:hypothetical protein
MLAPFLSPPWDVAHPSDREIKSRRLLFDPSPRFIGRCAEFLSWSPARETPVCAAHSALTDKSGDKFTGAARLDPGEKAAEGFHEVEILNHQLRGSLGIDLLQSCLAAGTRLARGAAA